MDSQSSSRVHKKMFILSNYILLGSASACIFLTLSLRLVPSLCGFLLILLHVITIVSAIFGCTSISSDSKSWHGPHMVVTVLVAIFQGSVSILIFTRTSDFLAQLKSYVREDDGGVILKLGGGLCILMFCLEWVVLGLAFVVKYNEVVRGEGGGNRGGVVTLGGKSAKVYHDEDDKSYLPFPFQV